MTEVFSYPVVKAKELVDGFRSELGEDFDIKEDDIKNPDKEKMLRIYSTLLAFMTGNSLDDLSARLVNSSPEMYYHVECQMLMSLTKFMNHVLSFCHLNCREKEFTIDDIILPNRKRVENILSSILNYIRFRRTKKQHFDEVVQKNDERVMRKEMLKRENEQLKAKVEEIERKDKEDSEAVGQIQSELRAGLEKFKQLDKENKALGKGITELDRIFTEKQIQSQKQMQRMTKVMADIQELDNQIIQSPDRLNAEISNLEDKIMEQKRVKDEKLALLNRRRRLVDLQRPVECQQVLKLITADMEKVKERRALVKQVADTRNSILEEEIQAKQLLRDVRKLERANAVKEEKLHKPNVLMCQVEEEAAMQLKWEEQKQKELSEKWDKIESDHKRLDEKISMAKKRHAERMSFMRSEFQEHLLPEMQKHDVAEDTMNELISTAASLFVSYGPQ